MPAKLDRCVRKVRARGGVKNPYAVCSASVGKKRGKRKKRRKRK